MAIENRNLEPGTRLVAIYKKQRYVCTVEQEGDDLRYVLEDGTKHKSPSSAGMKVMGGKAVNGWKFWSLEADEKLAKTEGLIDDFLQQAGKPTKPKKGKRAIYKAPNQQGIAHGKTRLFCVACMKSFIHDGTDEPQACPEGHRQGDLAEVAEATNY